MLTKTPAASARELPPTVAEWIESPLWKTSPLGPRDTWPQTLVVTVDTILRSQTPMIIFWGAEQIGVYNDAYADFVEISHPDGLGQPAREICSTQWKELGPTLQSVFDTGEPFSARDRAFNIVRDGRPETVYFDISYLPIPRPDGSTGGVLSVVNDTTEQVRARRHQAFLLALETRIRTSDTAHDILNAACEILGRELGANICTFAEIDQDARTLIVANEWSARKQKSALGHFPLEILGKKALPALHSFEPMFIEDVTTDPRTKRTAMEKLYLELGSRSSLEVQLVRDGQVHGLLSVGFAEPHIYTTDEITFATDTLERIWEAAERARAEQRLRESEAALRASEALARGQADLLAAVYDAAPIGLAVIDTNLRYVRVNKLLADMNGFPPDYHIGKTVRELVPDIADQAAELMQRVLSEGALRGIEIRGGTSAHPDDVRVWRENWVPMHDENGAVTGIAVSIEDVTKERKAERARQEALDKVALLSPRQRQVLQELMLGHVTKQIAVELGISVKTVEVHRSLLMMKLAVGASAEAVRIGFDAGLQANA